MSASKAVLFSLALGAAALAPRASAGQSMSSGWALNRYEPTPVGDAMFASDFPIYSGSRVVAMRAGILLDYAYRPLVLRFQNDPYTQVALVEHQLNLHAGVGIAVLNRFDLHLHLPVTLYNHGTDPQTGLSRVMAFNSPAVGDVRFGGRVRLVGDANTGPISLHLGAQLFLGFIPYTSVTFLNSDQSFRGRFYAIAAGRGGPLRWSYTVGAQYRPSVTYDSAGNAIGPDLFMTAGLGFAMLNDRLWLAAEGWFSTVFARAFQNTETNLELSAGIHYHLVGNLWLGAGGGGGLLRGAGTPAARALFQLSYAPANAPTAPPPPARPDRDRDGVFDGEDLCPDVPQGAHPDPARRGCPLGDRDHDGVLDPEDVCPEEPMGAHPDPARRGCPLSDRDGDGVFDPDDQCVDIPQGEHPDPERRGCPDGDQDADGVLDHADECRTVPAGLHPDPARPGCPMPDRDGDGVMDPVDHCPDQPGAPHPDPNRNGCPGLVRVVNGRIQLLSPVFFATNRDVILPRSFPVLTAVADALRATPEIRRIAVEGHTDDVGDDARNMDLSRRRAQSVVRFIQQRGVEAPRLEAQGFGETRPLVTVGPLRGRALAQARAQNRRVDFRIADPASN